MAEPFKNLLNQTVVANMATTIKEHYPSFNQQGFEQGVNSNLLTLELKARSDLITENLIRFLPDDFEQAATIIFSSLAPVEENISIESQGSNGIRGWSIVPFTYYVAQCGQEHFALSMSLFKAMTQRLSSEFGIRFFLQKHPEKTLNEMKLWTKDNNHHIRRLASEGCRPRLPWGIRLNDFVKEPNAVIELLELLKDDPSEYVRRSVANNLNDIAKDHPDLVANLMEKWLINASDERKRLISHACRTLLKNGHPYTLTIFGYASPKLDNIELVLTEPHVTLGQSLEFTLSVKSQSNKEQLLMIDYIIHHKKANGSTSPKVFKWRKINLPAKQKTTITKQHPMKKITTRVYYAGQHRIEIMINGKSIAERSFELKMQQKP